MLKEIIKSSNKVVGTKQVIKAVENGKAKLVIIARDADDFIINKIKAVTDAHSVDVEYVDTMEQLGSMCGIQVGAASAVILK
ncbi:MAG TPA: 50S ribosomal protein L7ae-like protein [Clostridiales bacterium]|nr:50S ribosomal protein L7ae-like protein [Clostridiales bacterium]